MGGGEQRPRNRRATGCGKSSRGSCRGPQIPKRRRRSAAPVNGGRERRAPSRATRRTICAKPGGATSTERRRARQPKRPAPTRTPRTPAAANLRECGRHPPQTRRQDEGDAGLAADGADENGVKDTLRGEGAQQGGTDLDRRGGGPARARRSPSGRHEPHGSAVPLVRPGALQGAAVLRHRRGDGDRPRRRDHRRCGGRPHRRRPRDHPAAERAGAPCGSLAPGSRGEGEGPGLRRAPRRGAAGGRRRGGGDGRARDRQGGAGCAARAPRTTPSGPVSTRTVRRRGSARSTAAAPASP